MKPLYDEWNESDDDSVEFFSTRLQKRALADGYNYCLWSDYAYQAQKLISEELLDGLEIEEDSYFQCLIQGIVLGACLIEQKQQELDSENEVHHLLFENVRT